MKTNEIYVGVNGAALPLQSGATVVAALPPKKGEKKTFTLLDDGKIANLEGSRIAGVSVARYLMEHNFELAAPGNLAAARLADFVDVHDGLKLVESQLSTQASALTTLWGGQACTVVPFEATRAAATVTVKSKPGYQSIVFDLQSGLSSAQVAVEFNPDCRDWSMGVDLARAWLVGPGADFSQLPRCTEYGGIVEQAVFVICNSGLGSLVGAQCLEMQEDCAIDAMFPKGQMEIALANGDHLTVGINAGDELGVRYVRGDVLLYERSGLEGYGSRGPTLGSAIGSIAAVLVRVQELDAVPVKVPRARAKKAA